MSAATKFASIAAEIETHPERWTKGEYARDSMGTVEAANSSRAVCWCSYGLMLRDHIVSDKFLMSAIMHPFNIATWNDAPERTAADVVAAFRLAAELAEQEGNG